MSTLTWLHLSDLHACKPKSGWDAGRVLDTLVADLDRLQREQGLRPDLIFFTGDAAWGELGSEGEETIAGQLGYFVKFLEQIRTVFVPEVALENVFLVPGNHDVNRKKVTRFERFWLGEQKRLEPVLELIDEGGPDWRRYIERLGDYRAFLEGHGFDHLLDDREHLIYSTVRSVGGLQVGIAGFNTAWSCCQDGERGRLWMAGKWQQGVLRSKLREADFSIALMHHPPDWLVEYENPDFRRGLEQDFRFLLHGHEHRAWVQSRVEGYVVLAAAACYERSETEHNGYNVVQLEPQTGWGEVWLRRFDAAGGGWIPCITAGRTDNRGVWPLRLPWLADAGIRDRSTPDRPDEKATVTESPPRRGEDDPAERYHVLRLLRNLDGWEPMELADGVSGRELVARLVRKDANAQVRSIAAEMLGIFEPIAAEGQVEPTVLTPGEAETRERVNKKDGTVLVYVPVEPRERRRRWAAIPLVPVPTGRSTRRATSGNGAPMSGMRAPTRAGKVSWIPWRRLVRLPFAFCAAGPG